MFYSFTQHPSNDSEIIDVYIDLNHVIAFEPIPPGGSDNGFGFPTSYNQDQNNNTYIYTENRTFAVYESTEIVAGLFRTSALKGGHK